MLHALLSPGAHVRHPDRPDWGIGTVQSVDGVRVTVMFEHAGKCVVISDRVELDIVDL